MQQAPHNLLAMGALILTLVLTSAILLALRAPLLGVDLAPDRDALRITSISADSLNRDRLAPGNRIAQIAGLTPDADLLIDDPDQIGEWNRFNALLDALNQLYAAAASGAIPAIVEGRQITLQVRDRTIADLPGLFWMQLTAGAIGFLVALGVFAYRPRDAGSAHFMLMGLGLLISVGTHAVFSSRELVFDGDLLGWLSRLNSLGALLFAAAMTSLLWAYPRRISTRIPAATTSYMIAALVWLGMVLQLSPDTSWLYTTLLAMVGVCFLLAALQWRASRHRPLERAALKWFLLAILLGTAVFTIVAVIPPALGLADYPSLETRVTAAMLLVLSIFIGIMLGITRYRLFELDRWWFTAWLWFLGGFMVIALDIALVTVLSMAQLSALAVSLALVGWLYFPLRQWLWSRFDADNDHDERQDAWLRGLTLATDTGMLRMQWHAALEQAYAPIRIQEVSGSGGVHIDEDGQALIIPDIFSGESLRLEHAARGARLFTRSDIRSAEMLVAMARIVQGAIHERERGTLAERERIRRDLHDDLGAKLLSLVYRTDGATQQLARSAIGDMRDILTALAAEPMPLADALMNWRAEAQQRAEIHGFILDWQDQDTPEDTILSARQHTNLGRILREAISNAVRHDQPHAITVAFALHDGVFMLSLSSQGQNGDVPPDQWKPGLGIQQMTRRTTDLGGTIRWESMDDGHRITVSIPLIEHGARLNYPGAS